jgi:hypothetical protein
MVNMIRLAIVACLGFLLYISIPIVAGSASIRVRDRVGGFYIGLASTCLKQWSFVRRVLSGYDIQQIHVDDEQKLLKTTLSSPLVGEDTEYRFTDPDNRILRLENKPVATTYEGIPAALDAELAEIGHWVREKRRESGFWEGDPRDTDEDTTVDPFVQMANETRLVDPLDAFELVTNDVDPENIKTAEELTKKRYEGYRSMINPVQVMSGVLGFFTGLGGVMAVRFFQNKILDGAGGGGVSGPEIPLQVASLVVEVGVSVV